MKKFIMILIFLFTGLYPQNRLNNQTTKVKSEKIVVGSLNQKRIQQVPRQNEGAVESPGSYKDERADQPDAPKAGMRHHREAGGR